MALGYNLTSYSIDNQDIVIFSHSLKDYGFNLLLNNTERIKG